MSINGQESFGKLKTNLSIKFRPEIHGSQIHLYIPEKSNKYTDLRRSINAISKLEKLKVNSSPF